MDADKQPAPVEAVKVSEHERSFLEQVTEGEKKKYTRAAMAAMGAIPWVGSVMSVAATLSAEEDQGKTNRVILLWLREHEDKLRQLIEDLRLMFARLDGFGDRIEDRIQSAEYLNLIRKTFRVWDQTDTAEKREMLRKTITNAGGVSIVQDDIVRLFIELIGRFNELHFRIIREVYANPEISNYELGLALFGEIPPDNSAKADLFKALMHDLNNSDLVRQPRRSDGRGQYLRKTPVKRPKGYAASSTMESPFSPDKVQILTELGKEFVHYVMEDLAPQLTNGAQAHSR